jgi:hypothetical protein
LDPLSTNPPLQDPDNIVYTSIPPPPPPSQNTNVSDLSLSPDLNLPQISLTCDVKHENTTNGNTPLCQFKINTADISIDKPNILPPGIIEMNIYADAKTSTDSNHIGLMFYLIGRTVGSPDTYTKLNSTSSDIEYVAHTNNLKLVPLNMYIQNPIDISDYDSLHFIIVATNNNTSIKTIVISFQDLTYSHIHTTFGTINPVYTFSNAGPSNYSLVSGNDPLNFKVKTLLPGNNITISDNPTTLTISGQQYSLGTTGPAGPTGISIVSSDSTINDFKVKSIVAGPNISITDVNNALTISGPSGTVYTLGTTGPAGPTGISIVSSDSTINDFKVKSIVAGPNISIIDVNNALTISGPSGTVYTLGTTGPAGPTGISIVSSDSTLNNFKVKSIVAGPNISITDVNNALTISVSQGMTGISTGYPFNPIQYAISTIASGNKSYWYICLISRATTIQGIQVYLQGGGSDPMRCGIYRGYLKSAVSGSITLVGQSTDTTVTQGLPYNRKNITVIPNQSLTFAVGDYMTIGFHSAGTTSVYYQNAPLTTLSTELCYTSSANYASLSNPDGFPLTLNQTSILGTLANRVCFELY